MAESEHRGSKPARSGWAAGPVLIDAALAVLVTVAVALAISAKVESEARDPDVFAYLFAVGLGGLMLVRRRWPTGVLLLTVAALFAYYLIGYPAVGVAVPVAGAVYSAAEQGRLRAAIGVSALVLVLSTVYRLTEEPAAKLLGFEGAQNLVLLVAVVALGDSVRARGALRRQARLQAEQARRDHERSAREQVEQERLRIAREVHDVLAHSVSAISIQSVVALEALPGEPAVAADALRSIREVSTTALNDLRSAVGVLREPAVPSGPVGGLADLDRLVATAADSGLRVDVRRTGNLPGVPLVVDAAAFRIVQESVTNVLKHAGSALVLVEVDARPHALTVQISNPGPAPDPRGSPDSTDALATGFGIIGMRERVELLGGTFRAGPTADGGFDVVAVLPLDSEPRAGALRALSARP